MAYTVKKIDVWTGEIEDRAGGLAAKLEPLASAGVDLTFVVARRQPHLPGKGVVFVGSITGAKPVKAAQAAGLVKAEEIAGLQVEGTNKAGAGYDIARRLGDAGINLRGMSAGVIGKKFIALIALDNAADADKAARLLGGAGK